MRENAHDKARRYLAEGRVILTEVTASRVVASIRGDGTIHQANYRNGMWSCSCEARSTSCSHLIAVRLCTAPDTPRSPR
jgi:uncharacterized Zn finger protein